MTPPPTPPIAPQPTRFFASLEIDTEKAGQQAYRGRPHHGWPARRGLTRTPGSNLRLTLEIAGRAGDDGYPKDVVDTVKANARDLKLDESALGFTNEE